jgi:hypothetical protein
MVKQPNPNEASMLRLIHRQETGEEMSSAEVANCSQQSLMQSRESGRRSAARFLRHFIQDDVLARNPAPSVRPSVSGLGVFHSASSLHRQGGLSSRPGSTVADQRGLILIRPLREPIRASQVKRLIVK